MIIIQKKRGVVRGTLAYFPDETEIRQLLDELPINGYLVAAQTTAEFEEGNHLVRKDTVRTTYINLNKTVDEIYKGMDSGSCRYRIKKAEKMLDKIHIELNTEKSYQDYLYIYNSFVMLSRHTYKMSNNSLNEQKNIADISVIYYDNMPMCGHLVFRDARIGRARLGFSGSRRHENKNISKLVGPLNRYLCWHEIKDYKSRGFNIFDFGGIGRAKGIDSFKLSFGGNELVEYEYNFAGLLGRMGIQMRDTAFEFRRRFGTS